MRPIGKFYLNDKSLPTIILEIRFFSGYSIDYFISVRNWSSTNIKYNFPKINNCLFLRNVFFFFFSVENQNSYIQIKEIIWNTIKHIKFANFSCFKTPNLKINTVSCVLYFLVQFQFGKRCNSTIITRKPVSPFLTYCFLALWFDNLGFLELSSRFPWDFSLSRFEKFKSEATLQLIPEI